MNDASGPVPIDFSLLLFFCFVNPIVFFVVVAGYFARIKIFRKSRVRVFGGVLEGVWICQWQKVFFRVARWADKIYVRKSRDRLARPSTCVRRHVPNVMLNVTTVPKSGAVLRIAPSKKNTNI